jgi:hypothetical protein
MTVITASDDSGLPVYYYFEGVSGDGKSSGWISSPTYTTETFSSPNHAAYRIRTKDAFGNETLPSVPWHTSFGQIEPSPPQDPNKRLIAHWKFDETSGKIAYDSAGDNDGNVAGSPIWTTGKIGGALGFISRASGVHIDSSAGHGSPLNIYNKNITLAAWVLPDSLGGGGTVITRANIGRGFPVSSAYRLYTGRYSPAGAAVGINTGAGKFDLLTGNILNPGKWYHIVGVFDRAHDTGIIYVNGVEQKRSNQMVMDPLSCDAPTTIGYGFSGKLDDVRIYNYALEVNEVNELFISSLKLMHINIVGPNSVPEESDTQYQVTGLYDTGSNIITRDITADVNLSVAPDEFAVIDFNGLLSTDRLYRIQELCTISADCQGLSDSKPVTIYSVCDGNQCTEQQLVNRDIADTIKIKQGVMDDLKYAMEIERASLDMMPGICTNRMTGWQHGQLNKTRMRILSAIMWELWANDRINMSVDSLEDALDLLQSGKPGNGPK